MNIIAITGRLTKDPELKYTADGTAICNFTLAVDRRYTKQQKTDFIPVVAWGKTGENCANYLSKGKQAGAVGELHIRSYETKDGKKGFATEIAADRVEFLSPKEERPKEAQEKPEDLPPLDNEELPF